jgi:hypothetical protein
LGPNEGHNGFRDEDRQSPCYNDDRSYYHQRSGIPTMLCSAEQLRTH